MPLVYVLSYSEVVRFGNTAEELFKALETALKDDCKQVASRLSQQFAGEGWNAKVEEISMFIERPLDEK
jgi:hypothetical protein